MIIAVDAVGGDFYPKNPITGALRALEENPSIRILLVGPENMIRNELSSLEYDASRVDILHAPEIVTMEDTASVAIKSKPSSSITLGIKAHQQGRCDAFVSAGNTGALLAASTILLGRLNGVLRSTIAATFPTLKGPALLIDAGANLELRPEMYYQFAKMGSIFSEVILQQESPTVGLVNVGEEREKGTDIHKEAYKLLETLDNFSGNIEGKDILCGTTNVFLTDGFTGNIILKFGESIPEMLKMKIAQTMKEQNMDEATQHIVYKLLKDSLSGFDYQAIGGVPFLGVNGVSLVGHGSSSPAAITNMIHSAVNCIRHRLNERIVSSLH